MLGKKLDQHLFGNADDVGPYAIYYSEPHRAGIEVEANITRTPSKIIIKYRRLIIKYWCLIMGEGTHSGMIMIGAV